MNWAEELSKAKNSQIEAVPAGWETMEQICKQLKCSDTHVRSQLNSLIGKTIERKKFRIMTETGSFKKVFHYKKK